MKKKDVKIIKGLKQNIPERILPIDSEHDRKVIIRFSVFVGFLILLGYITFLPVAFTIKILALVIGSFILLDIFRSLKI